MSKSKALLRIDLISLGCWIVGAGLVLVLLILASNSWRHAKARSYVKAAASVEVTNPIQAIADIKYALVLTPRDPSLWQRLADLYAAFGHPDRAVDALSHLHTRAAREQTLGLLIRGGKLKLAVTKAGDYWKTDKDARYLAYGSKAQLELGQTETAISLAEQAVRESVGDSQAQIQLGLTYAVGSKTDLSDSFMSSLTRGEALETLKIAGTSKYALSVALYNHGLLRSAERVLVGESGRNSEEQRLLATVRLALYPSDKLKLKQAASDLESAVAHDPADLKLHQQLKAVYDRLGDASKGAKQQDLIEKLENGKV